MEYLLFSLLAAIVIGIHIFSLKLLSKYDKYFIEISILVVVTMILSRFLIYYAMFYSDNPTNVHLLLSVSVFITFLASWYFFKLEKFDIKRNIGGMILVLLGFYFIQTSYTQSG